MGRAADGGCVCEARWSSGQKEEYSEECPLSRSGLGVGSFAAGIDLIG